MLTTITPDQMPSRGEQVYDHAALETVRGMLDAIKQERDVAVRRYAEQFDGLLPSTPLLVERDELKAAFNRLSLDGRAVLERTAERIHIFAEAQKNSLSALCIDIPGGKVGHDILPIETAGCYAPAGRFPLPSSVLMTVIPARVAGVKNVLIASPNPSDFTKAAAYIAGAGMMLPIGGAQAIGAMTYGTSLTPPADVIVGPGNKWVTAAKQIVSGRVGIDMLAGPSELMIIADAYADPKTIASDLIAQAEHDTDALPVLVTPSQDLIDAVNKALEDQIIDMPSENSGVATASLVCNGYAVLVRDLDEAVEVANRFAPEHLEILTENARTLASRLTQCGGLFIGSDAAEVIGDYGAGPNHTLPTGGTARHKGGLSVLTFMRVRTWIDITDPVAAQELYQDAAALGRMEGLVGHARSAEQRLKK